ncbi:CesT family type III secretion system chaperone [Halodesulfovibrio marinisediminis]|uniref:Tir chaperone protein (CesT) family protein n=1 Tax=Halodesulfovibrio marinisediminis DSM 17456 TaxID=1121457 RepID=A0A1N6I8F9_9BACT|nr:CesT family type III secretion system chaperone [Halodesulfovibrio marinisediminis]SIO28290.1 Tir chaperone protein (CesT) family protein [Halodesulfovibrio marinisediminis DSM 17456]
MIIEHTQDVLNYLGEIIKTDLVLDETMQAGVVIEDMHIVFSLLEEEELLITSAYIAPVPCEDATFLLQLLQGNYMWALTAGGTLSVDDQTGYLSLQQMFTVPFESVADIEEYFSDFLGAADYWKKQLAAVDEEQGVSDVTADVGFLQQAAIRI